MPEKHSKNPKNSKTKIVVQFLLIEQSSPSILASASLVRFCFNKLYFFKFIILLVK